MGWKLIPFTMKAILNALLLIISLNTFSQTTEKPVVSRLKVTDFKKWLES